MTGLLFELRLAVGFLTRFPVGAPGEVTPVHLGRSMAFFPLVGLLLGGLLLGGNVLFPLLFPQPVSDAMLLVVLVLASGALHLDGFADVCDGVGGGRTREDALRIMKDSRIGVFGATGLFLLLLVKYLALASLPVAAKPAALLLAPVAGRWAPVLLTMLLPYLRGPEGTGAAFAAHAGWGQLLPATVTLMAVAVGLFHLTGLLLVGLLALAGLGFAGWAKLKLGGATGDVLGAAVELLELLALLLVLALAKG